MKIYIASSREIGEKCKEWAIQNGYEITSMHDCDVFISVLYDKIISEEYIASRPCYNFHPGVLPWYRGAGAYSWAIINGEFETGVTLHKIDKDIDHGDIIHIQRFPIKDTDTAEDLFKKAENIIFDLFKNMLKILLRSDVRAFKQEEGRIYFRKDLEKARDLSRYIRAFTFKGKPNAYYKNKSGNICQILQDTK